MVITFSFFAILLLIEQLIPLRQRKHPFLQRFFINITLTAIVFLAGSLIVTNAAVTASKWALNHRCGLLLLVPVPEWAQVVIGVMLMDLTFYYWHMVNHIVPLLWRFHNVHHIDPDLDVTTSFRFHLIEILYSTVFRVLQVCLLGIVPLTYFVYGILFSCATVFHHSNIRLPIQLERCMNRIIVTPRMHGIHHSAVRQETNSNYSVIFRWWDSLNKTLVLNIPQSSIKIGVPAYPHPAGSKLWVLLIMPFTREKDYWKFADGASPHSNQDNNTTVTTMLK